MKRQNIHEALQVTMLHWCWNPAYLANFKSSTLHFKPNQPLFLCFCLVTYPTWINIIFTLYNRAAHSGPSHLFCVTIHPLKSPQEVQLPTIPEISPRTCLQFKYMCFTASKKVITKSLFRVFSVKRGHQFSKKYSLLHIHSRPASSSESSNHTPDGAFVVFFCHK